MGRHHSGPQAKQFDLIWSSMSITDERKKTIDFSNMYYNTPTVVIGAKNGGSRHHAPSISGQADCVQVSTTHERYAQKFFGAAGADVKTYSTQDEANNDLAPDGSTMFRRWLALDAFLQTDQGKACCELKGQVPHDEETLVPVSAPVSVRTTPP